MLENFVRNVTYYGDSFDEKSFIGYCLDEYIWSDVEYWKLEADLLKIRDILDDLDLSTIEEAKKLKKGYKVITDVTKFSPSSQAGALEIQKAQKFLLDNGSSKFIRIVESMLGKMQFSKTAREIGIDVVEVKNFEEALKHI